MQTQPRSTTPTIPPSPHDRGFATSDITMPLFDLRNVHLQGLHRVRPLEAADAALRLAFNPDDTGRFGSMVHSLSGASFKRYLDKVMSTPEGRHLYTTKPDLLGALRDRERLKSLPTDTLGYAYAEFAEAEDLSGDVLADVLWEYIPEEFQLHHQPPERQFFSDWGRDSHDLMHLILGYHTDILGEIGVLTFAGVQSGDMGVLTTMAAAQLYVATYPDGRRLAVDAVRRARRARPMILQNWVELLEVPIAEIRERLNVGDAPDYKPLFTKGRGNTTLAH